MNLKYALVEVVDIFALLACSDAPDRLNHMLKVDVVAFTQGFVRI